MQNYLRIFGLEFVNSKLDMGRQGFIVLSQIKQEKYEKQRLLRRTKNETIDITL